MLRGPPKKRRSEGRLKSLIVMVKSQVILLRHAEDVKAAIDPDDLAGGIGARVRREVDCRAADRLKRGVRAQGAFCSVCL